MLTTVSEFLKRRKPGSRLGTLVVRVQTWSKLRILRRASLLLVIEYIENSGNVSFYSIVMPYSQRSDNNYMERMDICCCCFLLQPSTVKATKIFDLHNFLEKLEYSFFSYRQAYKDYRENFNEQLPRSVFPRGKYCT